MNPRGMLASIGAVVAIALVALIGMALYALLHDAAPKENHDAIVAIIAFLTGNVATVVNFYFGSSASTRQNADTAARLADHLDTIAKDSTP